MDTAQGLLQSIENTERHLISGKFDTDVYISLVRQKMTLYYLRDVLPDDWTVYSYKEGVCLAQDTFLDIQDRFCEVESAEKIRWDRNKSISLLRKYLRKKTIEQNQQSVMVKNIYKNLSDEKKELFDKISQQYFLQFPQDNLQKPVIVAIPFAADAPTVWEDLLSIPRDLVPDSLQTERAAQRGLFYASQKFRASEYPCIDYFAYLYRSYGSTIQSVTAHLLEDAIRFGRTGRLLFTVNSCLNIPMEHPFAYSFFVARNDMKLRLNADIFELYKLYDIYNADGRRSELQWRYSGPELYRVIALILYERMKTVSIEKIWEILMAKMINVLLDEKDRFQGSRVPAQQKVSLFMKRLLTDLEINPFHIKRYHEKFI